MNILRLPLAALLVLLAAAGCGGGGSKGADPAPANPYRSISVSPASAALSAGGTQQLTVTGVDGAGKSVTLTSGITFSVTGTTVASVSSTGLVSALAIGSETVTAKVGDLTAVTIITVNGPYVEVAAGGSHSLARKSDGTLWAWGRNLFGQLGDGTRTDRTTPTPVAVAGTSKAPAAGPISAGDFHSVAIHAADSTMYAWGSNQNGRLGDGKTPDLFLPTKVGSLTWSVLSAGGGHTVGVKKDFTLWAWGRNSDGQLGVGNIEDKNLPTAVLPAIKTWKGAAAGANHTLAFKDLVTGCTSNVWTWGSDAQGQLGLSAAGAKTVPTCVVFPGSFVASAVAAGQAHSLAIGPGNSIWTWGDNTYGQLGRSATDNLPGQVCFSTPCTKDDNDWRAVAAGADHNLALRSDGSLWAWGYNEFGQLGDETSSPSATPIRIGDATDWVAIAAGKYFSFAIKANGTLWAWGRNQEGQLGNGASGLSAAPLRKPTLIP